MIRFWGDMRVKSGVAEIEAPGQNQEFPSER